MASSDALCFFDLDSYMDSPYTTTMTDTSSPGSVYPSYPISPEVSDPLATFFNDMNAMPMFDDTKGQQTGDKLFEQLLLDSVSPTTSTNDIRYGAPPVATSHPGFYNASPATTTMTATSPDGSPQTDGLLSPAFSPAPSDFHTSPEAGSPLPSFDSFDVNFQPMYDLDVSCGAVPPATTEKKPPIDLKKLDMLKAGAQHQQVRALFPELLPTIERLREVVLKKDGAQEPQTTTPSAPSSSVNVPWAATSTHLMQSTESTQPIKGRVGRKRKPRPTDPLLIAAEQHAKRQKNTEAARRSRLRKMLKMETLEEELKAVTDERDELRERVRLLEQQLERKA
ncbi:uncharacterized protein SPPG_06342 [Spizellomyces punctatus DAOM BR117]|uniref:BZIP domain-containing protein n=1 Tax=Spizellomyces punctatus (strain DAOM BR117) TaxID=645134 RepID=A0A0L0HCI7_SPIPD|nr:uncharacterized protein SPPG_06342 [Spizellomyces punctatus DAOM BR117]KNC98661.1 hypothetical protein SPPG_06342 [Spizellomyces punctatus DAOM BR117]|eukprot:XP_016606701.1 hypothetical protein SPPG_06342 [Spizellomyces punctatus DAOM BR117]